MTQVDEGPESLRAPDVLTVGAPRPGEILADRYQLEEHISNDPYGRQVWRGIDVILRRPIAVILRQPGGESAAEMLQAAVAASRVTHPHLADIYDAIDEGSKAYVVREWVEGISLREALGDNPLEPDRAITVANSIASAVAAFHATGMAHGNIHPGTVLLGNDGQVFLSDARADASTTPDADVRAVGGVLYAALTGHWPYRECGRTSLPDALRDPSSNDVLPARRIRGGVPSHLSDLAGDLLDPQTALPSADVLAAELGRLAAEQEEELFEADQVGIGGGFLPMSGRSEPRRPIGRKLAIGVVGLLVIAIVGLLIGNNVLNSSSSNTANTPGVTASSTAPKPGGNGTKALTIAASQVRLVDPNGNRTESKDLGKTVDGDGTTSWHTDHYNSLDYFTTTKKGMGILLDLGSVQSVADVKIDFANPGATVDLRSGTDTAPDTKAGDQQILASYTPVVPATQCESIHDFVLPTDTAPTRYLLIWISVLPVSTDDATRYQLGISEIKVSVNG